MGTWAPADLTAPVRISTDLNNDGGEVMSMPQSSPEETARLRRLLPERAIALAMQSRWAEAVDVNKAILSIDPNDADAHNRIGKAHLELGQYSEAYAAYKRAVELAPGNAIAQKNMLRIAPLAQQPAAAAAAKRPVAQPRERLNPHTFIEETGKTGVTHLVDLASGPTLLALAAGDRLQLVLAGSHLEVRTEAGGRLGHVEPKLAHRLMRFLQAGNRYSATVTTVSEKSLTIIIREEYQAPAMLGRQSFPSKGAAAAYRPAASTGRYGYDEDEDSGADFDADADTDTDAEDTEEEAEFEDDDIEERD
jgi:tetratricopeptide (TPR) repeat protein